MKIGVALSGCGIGGVGAWDVLCQLNRQGFDIAAVSASGLPAIGAILYSLGFSEKKSHHILGKFIGDCKRYDLDTAIEKLVEKIHPHLTLRLPLSINSVNVADGKICAFASGGELHTSKLDIFPLEIAELYDVLSATISPADGMGCYSYKSLKLCDFSTLYGVPVYPLYMAGVSRVVSVAFVPVEPQSMYESTVRQKLVDDPSCADISITVESGVDEQKMADLTTAATEKVRDCIEDIYIKVLF